MDFTKNQRLLIAVVVAFLPLVFSIFQGSFSIKNFSTIPLVFFMFYFGLTTFKKQDKKKIVYSKASTLFWFFNTLTYLILVIIGVILLNINVTSKMGQFIFALGIVWFIISSVLFALCHWVKIKKMNKLVAGIIFMSYFLTWVPFIYPSNVSFTIEWVIVFALLVIITFFFIYTSFYILFKHIFPSLMDLAFESREKRIKKRNKK